MPTEQIVIPAAPATPEVKGHYFIHGEWNRIIPAKKVVAPGENPPQDVYQKVFINEAIAMHPAVFVVLVQEARPGFRVTAWSGISKELYDWYIETQKLKQEAIQRALSKNGGGG